VRSLHFENGDIERLDRLGGRVLFWWIEGSDEVGFLGEVSFYRDLSPLGFVSAWPWARHDWGDLGGGYDSGDGGESVDGHFGGDGSERGDFDGGGRGEG
jgi:hypothetical protein